MKVQDFIQKGFSYAIIGATSDKDKYGYKVLKDLHRVGFNVVGVNPKYSEIDGVAVYSTLADVPGNVDVAVFVVPPEVGLSLLPQVEEKGISKVWFQPGAESEEITKEVSRLQMQMNEPLSCIMVMRHTLGP